MLFDNGFVADDMVLIKLVERHADAAFDVESQVIGDMEDFGAAHRALEVNGTSHQLSVLGLVGHLVHPVVVLDVLDQAAVAAILHRTDPASIDTLRRPCLVILVFRRPLNTLGSWLVVGRP